MQNYNKVLFNHHLRPLIKSYLNQADANKLNGINKNTFMREFISLCSQFYL